MLIDQRSLSSFIAISDRRRLDHRALLHGQIRGQRVQFAVIQVLMEHRSGFPFRWFGRSGSYVLFLAADVLQIKQRLNLLMAIFELWMRVVVAPVSPISARMSAQIAILVLSRVGKSLFAETLLEDARALLF